MGRPGRSPEKSRGVPGNPGRLREWCATQVSYRPQASWGGQLLLMNWGRKSHFKRIGPRESVGAHPCTCKSLLLQAASVFRGHGSRPNRAEGNLYVHGSRSGRAEGALNVQPTCLGVQRSSARSSSREIQPISILVPRI